MAKKVTLIYEDESLVLVAKKPGTLTIPDRYHPEFFNLKDYLESCYGKIYVVHRLDKDTSGIICFAKTADAHRQLSRQFQDHSIRKAYWVLVSGQMAKEEGEIDQPIAPIRPDDSTMQVQKKGKPAKTLYRVLECFRDHTLIEARIVTGRTHQIRVHFQWLGHPLSVDPVYGGDESIYLSSFKQKGFKLGKDKIERPLIKRVSLHAKALTFNHPDSQKLVTLEAPLPKDFAATLNQLRKWSAL